MSADVPIGAIIMWAGSKNSIPEGWLYCNGQILQQTGTYAALFTQIGHSFGNPAQSPSYNPGTQFFLPDLRGYFVRGVDDGAGRDPESAGRTDMQSGATVGGIVGSVQTSEVGPHLHNYPTLTTPPMFSPPPPNYQFTTGNQQGEAEVYWDAASPVQTANSTGAESRPVNAYLYFIIKAQ